MAGIDFASIPTVWKDCTGYHSAFASEQIEHYVSIPSGSFSNSSFVRFTSPHLREPLFNEAVHYVDRALYQLIVGKTLVSDGKLAWGLIAYYYSSFFSAQAAIRLKGIFFVKVNYDSETNPPPTHRLEVVNLLTNQYRIRKAGGRGGEHQRVWKAFYEEFKDVASRPNWARYQVITAEQDPELRLVEMHQRHLVNYVPGRGYVELRSPNLAEQLRKALAADVIANQAAALNDDYLQLEMRAFLRLRFCLQILSAIDAEGGVYHLHHANLAARRRGWLNHFVCHAHLRPHLDRVLV